MVFRAADKNVMGSWCKKHARLPLPIWAQTGGEREPRRLIPRIAEGYARL